MNLFNTIGRVTDLDTHGSTRQGFLVLVLACQEQRGHPNQMHILVFQDHTPFLTANQIRVEDRRGEEVSSRTALVGRGDLDKPVQHLGPVVSSHFVAFQRVVALGAWVLEQVGVHGLLEGKTLGGVGLLRGPLEDLAS